MRLAQSILKRKFPSVDKPLQKYAQEEPLKNISPGAYFRNFTVLFKNWAAVSCGYKR